MEEYLTFTYDPNDINITGSSHDFTTRLANAINLKKVDNADEEYAIALDNVTHGYTWYNISAAYGNNTFSYFNGVVNRNVVIPDGQYPYQALNDAIHRAMDDFGDYTLLLSGARSYDINLVGVFSNNKIIIYLTNGYTIDFTAGDFRLILGFDAGVYVAYANTGQNLANFNNDVTEIQLHIKDISDSTYDRGQLSDVIYSWSMNVKPGSQQKINVVNRVWIRIVAQIITTVRLYFTDQLGRPIDFNGEDTTVSLVIKQIR